MAVFVLYRETEHKLYKIIKSKTVKQNIWR